MSDKTYAETQGEVPFDWWKALETPPERHSPGHWQLRELSKSWVTCACGNQCAIIPRADHETIERLRHAPLDSDLASLGADFHEAVVDGLWPEARTLLKYIEERSAVIITEELAKLNTP